jgi:hypothetical protein
LDDQKGKNQVTSENREIDQEKKSQGQVKREIT